MRFRGDRRLSVLLIGALLFCHGVFGALHLACYPPLCAGDAEHAAGHQATAGGAAVGAHEHPEDHGTSTGDFAVLVVGILGFLLGVLPERAPLRISLAERWPVVLRRVPAVLCPPPTPTPLALQVFRL